MEACFPRRYYRILAWTLCALAGVEVLVAGEYERAFFGDQALTVLPLLDAAGVRLWLPEAHGPVDLDEPSRQGW